MFVRWMGSAYLYGAVSIHWCSSREHLLGWKVKLCFQIPHEMSEQPVHIRVEVRVSPHLGGIQEG